MEYVLGFYIYSVIFSFMFSFLFMKLFLDDVMQTNRMNFIMRLGGNNTDNSKNLILYLIPVLNILLTIGNIFIAISYRNYVNGKSDFNIIEKMEEILDEKEERERIREEREKIKEIIKKIDPKIMKKIEQDIIKEVDVELKKK